MPVQIRVRDFQSIHDATIIVDGLTVVTGPNNAGKSALQRAVRAAFQNARGSSFVRRGTTKSVVDIDFCDGHSVHWEKGSGKDTKPTYIIDGGSPLHPGQGVPDELGDLGVKSVVAGGKTLWPQFAPQFTGQVFLLDESGAVLAEAVADVDRVGQLNQALRLAESDRRAGISERKVRHSDAERLEQDLQRYDGVDDLGVVLDGLEKDQSQVVRMTAAISGLEKLKSDYDRSVSLVSLLSGVLTVEVPNVGELQALGEGIAVLSALHSRFQNADVQVKRLSGLEDVDTVVDTESIVKVGLALDILDGLETRWKAATEREQAAEKEVSQLVKEAEEVEQSVAAFLEEIGTCPYCGSSTASTGGSLS